MAEEEDKEMDFVEEPVPSTLELLELSIGTIQGIFEQGLEQIKSFKEQIRQAPASEDRILNEDLPQLIAKTWLSFRLSLGEPLYHKVLVNYLD